MRIWCGCTCGVALLVLGCSNDDSASSKATGGATSGTAGTAATGTGGQSQGTSGSSSAGSSSAGTGNNPKPPLPQVAACDALPEAGVFEEITPPEVRAGIGTKSADNQTKGGTFAMAVDQVNQGTVYAGTLFQGVWKTTDCGATWKVVATGTRSEDVNRGMNWTLFIDPVDPNVVYTNSGYGSNGLFKSTDGGVNWTDIWSRESQPELAKAFTYNFANVIAIDPQDHLHILLTFHEECLAPHNSTCIVETKDGGSTWRILDGEPGWNGSEGQVIFFLESSNAWLWGSQTNGFWRSDDAGTSWTEIMGMTTSHLQSSQILRTKAGVFYAAGADGIWTSSDGKVPTWKLIPNTGPILGGLVSDGTNMYASTCYFGDFCDDPRYLTSPETDGQTWTEMKHPKMTMGGNLGYDAGHKLLFSSNLDGGLWRVEVP